MVMEDAAARTLPAMLAWRAAHRGDRLAVRYKRHGIWHRVTWREYGAEVRRVAAALLAFGLRPHENVAVLGDNRPEWLYGHLGIGRREVERMREQHDRNFVFFDAPVGMIFTIDRRLNK